VKNARLLAAAWLLLVTPLVAQEADRVELEPGRLQLRVDESRTPTVTVYDRGGAALEGAAVQWFTTTPDLVSVDPSGRITALRPGEGQVSVVSGSAAAFITVLVLQDTERLEASLPVETLALGTSAPLAVQAFDPFGDEVVDPELRFESSDPTIVSVDARGRVFSRAVGQTSVRVRSGEASTAVQVQVADRGTLSFELRRSPAEARTGDVVRLQMSATDAAGAPVPVHPAWTVSTPGAEVSAEGLDGVFVAEKPGTYRVTAQIGEGAARSTILTVTPRSGESHVAQVGRGPTSHHNSGDAWVFEGVDGRDYAYIGTYAYDWMKVWDVTDPSNPVLTDSLQADARRLNDVKIHPNNRLAILTREGASNRRNGIVVLDLSDPAHPSVSSEYTETVTGGVHNVWIDGEHDLVYACHNGTSELHIIDISDPTSPVEVGRWGIEKQGKTLHDVIIQDGYAYLSYWDDGLITLDVGAGTHGGSPREPAFVSQFKYPIGNTHTAWRSGRYLFVGDEIYPDGWSSDRPIEARGFIHVVDYTDVNAPVEVATYEVPEAGAHNFWVEDDKLYVGYYQAGLRVVDVSGELRGDLYRQGRELGVLKTMDGDSFVPNWPMTWGAQVFKGNIFSSDMNSGLWVTRLVEEPAVVF